MGPVDTPELPAGWISGIPIFPLMPRSKIPATPRGFKDATTNETTIRGWWAETPLAGIGMPTGAPSGIDVLDVDPKNGGEVSFNALDFEIPKDTPRSITGGGGYHFFFAHSADSPATAPGFRNGLDWKAEGGYVVLPPSIHPSGKRYAWTLSLLDGKLRPPPADLVTIITGRKANKPRLSSGVNGPPIPQGEMQTTLFRIAAASRRFGLDEDLILEHLRRVNKSRCGGLFEDDRIAEIARRMDRYEPDPKVERSMPTKTRGARGVRGA